MTTQRTQRTQRPTGGIVMAITFQYYRDLAAAMIFYEEILGFRLAIDQGWSKIYCVEGQAHVGLVDETRGMQDWAEKKTCQICLRVPDVDAWHTWATSNAVDGLTDPRDSDELGIRAFVMNDPEGYQIEVQTAKPGY
jgi:lactoylglutathione lyase